MEKMKGKQRKYELIIYIKLALLLLSINDVFNFRQFLLPSTTVITFSHILSLTSLLTADIIFRCPHPKS